MRIGKIKGREILDSRSNPTLEVELILDSGIKILASAPSGKSTGTHEAKELRDGDEHRYFGMGVLKAVENINSLISDSLKGKDPANQSEIDRTLIELDGTPDKSKLGANATIATSIACLKAGALDNDIPLYKYIANIIENRNPLRIPTPMFNVINGGAHADNNLHIQEYMIVPTDTDSFAQRLCRASECYHRLKKSLENNGYSTTVGDEGGFAPNLPSDKYALDLLEESDDIKIAFDFAGNLPPGWKFSEISNNRKVISLEDPLGEDSWEDWQKLTEEYGARLMLVGDDLFSTNIKRLQKGVKMGAGNAIIIKPNQIGTITETFETIKYARQNKYMIIASHRSGETEDTAIADIAVGVGANFIKSGAPARGERIAKYNRLLRIEEELLS